MNSNQKIVEKMKQSISLNSMPEQYPIDTNKIGFLAILLPVLYQ